MATMKNHIVEIGFVMVLVLPMLAYSQDDESASTGLTTGSVLGDRAGEVSSAPNPDAAIDLLRSRVKEAAWDEEPFSVVLEWLREKGRGEVNVIPMWTSLNNDGVDEESLVKLRLHNVLVANVLNEVIDQLADGNRIRYQATGNSIRIATQGYFDSKMVVRVYQISDILFRVPNFLKEAPQIDLSGRKSGGGGSGGGGSGGGGGGGQGSIFQGGSGGGGSSQLAQEADEEEIEQRLEELKEVILQVIEPLSWREGPLAAGGPGEIAVYNRLLIIRNTLEVHEQIAGFFDKNR